jgi:alpha-amylase
MYKFILFFSFAIFFINCKNEPKKETKMIEQKTGILPEWAKDAVIYEVNIRQYSKEGTINAFSEHIPRLKELGVDIIWLMPVFPISETKRKGTLGSYYAVSDFRKVNPEFGTLDDLKNLVEKIHAYKMKVIFDWVPNHTGWDHTWIKSNPDFYTKGPDGNITDPLNEKGESMGWADVADLNYDNKDMRKAMTNDLLFWVKEYGIDGYRMDIAWGVPLDFWKACSDTLLKTNPNLFMLAEAENADQLNSGYFHAGYGWTLHHLMNAIAKKEKKASDIDEWFKNERSKYKQGSLMHFITNHDENSWNGTEFDRMGAGYRSFAILAMTLDGIPLIYTGQEKPLNKKLQFFEKDPIEWDIFKDQDFYAQLCDLKHKQSALWNEPYGTPAVKIGESEHVYAYKRENDKSKVIVVLNLSDQQQKVKFTEDISNMFDIFRSTPIANYKAGQETTLEPWDSWVLISK